MSKGLDLVFLALAASFAAACSGPSSEPTGTSRAAAGTAFPNDQTAYDYFRAKGLPNFQAAGIVGNLDQESGVDPTIAEQGGGPGRGIAQWSVGGRWDTTQADNLVAFAAQENLPSTSLTAQLDFIWYELQMFPNYGLAMLQASTNVTDATIAFETDFEECASCDESQRITYAMDVLNAYGNDPVVSDGGTGSEAGTTSDAGESDAGASEAGTDDVGTGNGGSSEAGTGDDAGSTGGVDAAGPSPGDTGAPVATSDSGGTEEAGESAAVWGQGSGCAVANAGWGESPPGAWLAALGCVLVAGRRRRSPATGI